MKAHTTYRKGLFALFLFLAAAASSLFGQSITSSAISGRVVDSSGNAVAGATVEVRHAPTGSVYTDVTRESGRFNFANMRVGGPYTVTASADGLQQARFENLFTALGQTSTVNLRMPAAAEGEVVQLEEFVVEGRAGDYIFDASNMGVYTSYGASDISSTASTRRHLNDVARLNPFVTVNEEDRNEMTALGQSNRFNSVMLDGVRINDQFGLDSSGVQSFRNPVSLDALEAITVELSPYDVRKSGFTGAAVNAVTKSGTNEFSGSVYTYYTDDALRGEVNGLDSYFEETTWGITLGGPVIKDKLFFFAYYEEFERIESGGVPGFDPDPDALDAVYDFNADLPFEFGTFGAAGQRVQPDKKYLVKLDWNINDDHRLAVKYQATDGENPLLGNFGDSSETALDSHFYAQVREERFYTAQLYSRWTPDLESEISFGYNRYRQPTSVGTLTPQILIEDFPVDDGVAGSYSPTGTGTLFFGTEQFRHANNLDVDTYNFSASADYFASDVTYTFGVDLEDTTFSNLFLESSFANFGFDNLSDYFNGVISTNSRYNYRNTGVVNQNPVADSDLTVTGAYVQASWNVSPRLHLNAGLRVDYTDMGTKPPKAFDRNGVAFEDLFGIPNDGTIDGNVLAAPRVSFNYKPKENEDWQLRGGVGVFQGRAPGVWISNGFTNNGETSNRIEFRTVPGFDWIDYMSSELDPANPIIYIQKAVGTPEVNVTEDGLALPWIVRANLATDIRVGDGPWVVTLEGILTKNYDTLYIENINLKESGTAPDGRIIYSGRIVPTFANVFVLRNVDAGVSRNIAVSLEREMTDGWFAKFSYVNGHATDVNPYTSSRAVSNYFNRQVYNVNDPEEATSNFEIKHRLLVMGGVEFDLVKDFTTRVTLIYEARTGRPYSPVFSTDVNGDTDRDNDLLYIPAGPNDPKVAYDPGFNKQAFFDYIGANGLDTYAGGVAPRNSLNSPWVHRVDLKVEQEIPVWKSVGLTLFVDFINVLNMIDEDWGLTEEYAFPYDQAVVNASVQGGRYLYRSFSPESIRAVSELDGKRSRWAIQLGAKLSF